MRALAGPLVALLALGSAGCGGGSSSHRGFVDAAADVCRDANRRFAELEIVQPSAAGAAAVMESVVSIGAEALTELRELKPPTGSQGEVEAWLGLLEQALDEVQYTRDLLRDDHVAEAVAAAVRADQLTRRARTVARRVGLDRACRVPQLVPTD